MILLPDMTIMIDGTENKLSLQDPYTLNGKLITQVYLNSEPETCYATDCCTIRTSDHNIIQIRNEEDYYIAISEHNLSVNIQNELSRFFSEHNANEVRVGENRYMWYISRNYGIDYYIRDLGNQCDRISNSYITFSMQDQSFIGLCRERLRNQGRLQEESSNRTWTTNPYIYGYDTATYTNVLNSWNTFGTTISQLNSGVLSVASASEEKKKYIHEYNYKPTYIKNYMPDEDKSSLLLGAEIEVAGNDRTDLNKEDVVKKCIQIMNGSDDDTEDLIYSTSDSTVQIELDTMPCTLNYHKKRMNYKELFKYLDELGYKGHDCENAGLHIHADRSYLGNTELKQQLVITKILYILEKFNDEICVIARRNNNYSQFVGKEEVNKTLHKLYSKYKDYGKKVALNLQHEGTIEFRCFRSTLKYETFILTLEFVKDIIDYAKTINIEDIELIQWSDLMNTFSNELKEYYNDRLEKENKKKKEEKKSNISLGSGNLYFTDASGESIAIGRFDGLDTITTTIDESCYENTATASQYRVGTYTPICTFNLEPSVDMNELITTITGNYSLGIDSSGNQSISRINTTNIISNVETIENLEDPIGNKKKEIKSLKKRINNSRNYMEKVQLSAELNEAQKELKKLKRERNTVSNDSNNTNNISNDTVTCTSAIANLNTVNSNRTMYVDDCCSTIRWCY